MWNMEKVLTELLNIWAEYNCPDVKFDVTVTTKEQPTEKG